ncbi:MAG: hypothetical protein LBV74_00865 [Tannerella sp.]|nr:hypothetical protein [Tannerella sp.]
MKIPLPIELRAFYGLGDTAYRVITEKDELRAWFKTSRMLVPYSISEIRQKCSILNPFLFLYILCYKAALDIGYLKKLVKI